MTKEELVHQIYEDLHDAWCPNHENTCFVAEEEVRLAFIAICALTEEE